MGYESRPLTPAEREMARGVFGDAVDYDPVRVHHRKWIFFQPTNILMSPTGGIWVHPKSIYWSDDYANDKPCLQELFIHEMTHVWQAQTKGRWYLPLMRHPFCRYDYEYRPGRPFGWYGLEQQAEIVRHVFARRQGWTPYQNKKGGEEAPALKLLEPLLPFGKCGHD